MRTVAISAFLTAAASTSLTDLRRASATVPGERVQGADHLDMTRKLNAALRATGLPVRPCSDFSAADLAQLQSTLFAARDPALQAIYQEANDPRRLAIFGEPVEEQAAFERLLAEELETLRRSPALHDVSRDGKCHETVMWLVHHVPEERRASLSMAVPLLPEQVAPHAASDFAAAAPEAAVQQVFRAYAAGLGCSVAHASGASPASSEYVEWPAEVRYSAMAHGNFPFWDNKGKGCSTCDHRIDGNSRLEVMYSSVHGAENLLHEFCGDMTWTGAANAPKHSPCNHLFTADGSAYIYTPLKALEPAADGKFCCRSYEKGQHQFTGAVPRDWMKGLTYAGTASGFKGDYYEGDVKMFTYSIGRGLQFWYYASPDGLPVEQGEGCYQPNGQFPSRSCAGPVVLFHDWNQSSFKETSYVAADFVVPEVCQSTRVLCSGPGGKDFLQHSWDEENIVV